MSILRKILSRLSISALAVSALSLSHAYEDVPEDAWYYSYISDMTQADLVGGSDDGNFYPNEYLSLAEFSAMMSNAFYGETVAGLHDKFNGYWWEPYLYSTLLRKGMDGTQGDAFFYSNAVIHWDEYVALPVTRYDVAMMVLNMMNDRQVNLPGQETLLSLVADKDLPSDYIDAVAVANYYSIMAGRDGDFDGEAFLTRAEAVVVLSALCQSSEVNMELLRDFLAVPEVEVLPESLEPEDLPSPEAPEEDGSLSNDVPWGGSQTVAPGDSGSLSDGTGDSGSLSDGTGDSGSLSDGTGDGSLSDDVGDGSLSDDVGDGSLSDGTGDGSLSDDVGDGSLSDDVGDGSLSDDVGDGSLSDNTGDGSGVVSPLWQEALNEWKPYTILGESSPNSYIEHEGLYLKNLSSNVITVEDLANPANVQLVQGMEAPQILIYHSHATESFNPTAESTYTASGYYRSEDTEHNVVAVGAAMAEIFAQAGFKVIHDTALHDAANYNNSYDNSRMSLEQFVADNPSLVLILDVHRDALENSGVPYQLQSVQNGETYPQVMLFVGSEDKGSEHPYWRENLALALQLQEGLMDYGDFARPITVASYPYNQAVHPGTLLLEVGNHGNTLAQGIAGGVLFAKSASSTLTGLSVAELFGE